MVQLIANCTEIPKIPLECLENAINAMVFIWVYQHEKCILKNDSYHNNMIFHLACMHGFLDVVNLMLEREVEYTHSIMDLQPSIE